MFIIIFHTNIHILEVTISCYLFVFVFISIYCNATKGQVSFILSGELNHTLFCIFTLMCSLRHCANHVGMGRGLLPKAQKPVVACGVILGGMNILQVVKSLSFLFKATSCFRVNMVTPHLRNVSCPFLCPLSSHASLSILPLCTILPLSTHISTCTGKANVETLTIPAWHRKMSQREESTTSELF